MHQAGKEAAGCTGSHCATLRWHQRTLPQHLALTAEYMVQSSEVVLTCSKPINLLIKP